MPAQIADLKTFIRDIPDWPKPGILFRDITPLLADPDAYNQGVAALIEDYRDADIDCVAAVEARGFIFGTTVAERLGVGFIPVRKKGKLPAKTIAHSYDLEYGSDTIEIHEDAVSAGTRVLLVDDLLATGGTMKACCDLVDQLGGDIVGVTVLIELGFLPGRERLRPHDNVHAVVEY